jgi:nucleoside-diphosphate-sugar epimerase
MSGAPPGEPPVPQRVFITGANGFIGRSLARRYRTLGAEVCGIDFVADPEWGVIAADMLQPGQWRHVIDGSELAIHTAALLSNTAAMHDAWRTNVLGTYRVIEAAEAAGVKRLLHVSSVAVFGFDHLEDVDENAPLKTINHPYVDTKILGEYAVLQAHASGRLPATVIRPGDVYGPGSRPWVLLPLEMIRVGRFLLPAHGKGVFSPVYIDDLVDGIVIAGSSSAAIGQIFSLTGAEKPSCAEYFSYIARMAGKSGVRTLSTPAANLVSDLGGSAARLLGRKSELGRNTVRMLSRRAGYSITKAQRLLGYQPRVTLAEGMQRVERWLRDTGAI